MADVTRLGRKVVIAVYAWMGSQMVVGAASLLELPALTRMDPGSPVTSSSSAAGPAIEMFGIIAAAVYTIAFLVAAILVLTWIHLVNRNAHLFADDMSVSPGWNVGFFFVPLLTWWKPFVGIRETWQVSQSPSQWRDVPVPAFLRWWWACWLASSMLGYASLRLSLQATMVDELIAASVLDIIDAVVSIPLGLLLLRLVRELTQAQSHSLIEETFS
jgi:hypothetical protein